MNCKQLVSQYEDEESGCLRPYRITSHPMPAHSFLALNNSQLTTPTCKVAIVGVTGLPYAVDIHISSPK